MTRDELIGKLALIIFHNEFKECDSYETAEEILNAIFDVLKEPTDDMVLIGEIAQSVSEGLGEERDVQVQETYRAMINASPLDK